MKYAVAYEIFAAQMLMANFISLDAQASNFIIRKDYFISHKRYIIKMINIIYSLPDMLMIILLSVVLKETLKPVIEGTILAKLGVNMISLFVVFGCLYWVGMARLVRGQILSIKENEYILAARAIGAKPGRIIKKHILPNCISVIIISLRLLDC